MAKSKRGEGPNKMGLVREAIAALGANPKPKAIHEHVKAASGVDIPPAMISSYKSMILKKGKKKKRGPGRPPKSASMGGSSHGSVSFDDVIAVKGLVNRFGASKLSDLIKLLAK
jgi:hypothetical protein